MKRYKERTRVTMSSLKAWLIEYYALLLVLCSGLIVRLYQITNPINDWMSFRQTQTASTILNYYRDGINILLPRVNSIGDPGILVLEFPLYQAIGALIYKLTSPDIIYIRLFSIACCLVTAVYLYKLVQRFFDKETALYAAIFFLFAPLSIFFSRTPMIESFASMLSIMFLYYFIIWIEQKKPYFLVFGIILASLALIVKSPYSLVMLPMIVYYAYHQYGLRKILVNYQLLIGMFIPLLVLVLWQMYANHTNNLFNSLSDYPYNSLHKAFEVKISELNTWYFSTVSQRFDLATYFVIGKRIVTEVLVVIGFVLIVFSFPLKNIKHGFLFEVWLLSVLLSFFVILNLNYVHNYYQLPCVAIMAIYCGKGLKVLIEKITSIPSLIHFRYRILVLVFIAYIIGVYGVIQLSHYYESDTPGYYQYGQRISSILASDESMVAISTTNNDKWNPTMLYFADKKGYIVPQSILNQDMIDYLIRKNVKWLIVVAPDPKLQTIISSILEKYPVLPNTGQDMIIYQIYNTDKE
jgi:hypothetical protein